MFHQRLQAEGYQKHHGPLIKIKQRVEKNFWFDLFLGFHHGYPNKGATTPRF